MKRGWENNDRMFIFKVNYSFKTQFTGTRCSKRWFLKMSHHINEVKKQFYSTTLAYFFIATANTGYFSKTFTSRLLTCCWREHFVLLLRSTGKTQHGFGTTWGRVNQQKSSLKPPSPPLRTQITKHHSRTRSRWEPDGKYGTAAAEF